jgi:hypothetical protein
VSERGCHALGGVPNRAFIPALPPSPPSSCEGDSASPACIASMATGVPGWAVGDDVDGVASTAKLNGVGESSASGVRNDAAACSARLALSASSHAPPPASAAVRENEVLRHNLASPASSSEACLHAR